MSRYSHVFFDLDHTLWDFARNSEETLRELHDELQLEALGAVTAEAFLDRYYHHNRYCWQQYRTGQMTKEQVRVDRFIYTLHDFGISQTKTAYTLADEYLARSPHKPHLLPHAKATLDYLQSKYPLHLITNGFEEVQHTKLKVSGLARYFTSITTSEKAGVLKPHEGIFTYALQQANAKASEVIYIGDNLEADVLGAQAAGWHQVYFNPAQQPHVAAPTFEISALNQLCLLL